MTTYMMTTISEGIRETIDDGIAECQPEMDPVFKSILRTSVGVYSGERKDGCGRDWKFKKVFSRGISGAHAYRNARGPAVTLSGQDEGAGGAGISVYSDGNSWQSVGQMAGPGILTRTLTLVEGYGGFPVPFHLMRADQLNSSVGSMVSLIVKGASMRHSLCRVHSFWKVSNSTISASENVIGGFTADDSGTDITTTAQNVTLTSGRVRAFYPGLLLDIYNSTGATQVNSSTDSIVAVVSVDYLAGVLRLRTISGTAALSASTAYTLKPHNVDTVSTWGFDNWIQDNSDTGVTIFDDVELDYEPQFRSIVASESGALTSDKLNKYIGGFEQAYGVHLDTIIMDQGTLTGFLENLDSTSQLIRYEGQDRALRIKAGFESFGYTFGGHAYNIMVSPNCPTGTVYIVKLNNGNIKQYVPPKLPTAQADGRFAGELEFVGPSFGFNGIFMPALTSSGAYTDTVLALYLDWCQFAPDEPQSIKLTGFDTNIHVG